MRRGSTDSRLRLRRIFDKSNALIDAVGDDSRRSATASPRIAKRSREVSYTLSIRGELHDPSWEFELAEVLFHTRALLDNLTWDLAHDDPPIAYTPEEERNITFPIARARKGKTAQENWDYNVRIKPHLKRMSPERLARLRAMQPFDAEVPPDAVLNWVEGLHQVDKHRSRIRIMPGIDSQWPVLFPMLPGEAVEGATYNWLPKPDAVLRSGLPLVKVTTERAVTAAKPIDVPISYFVWLDGERYDHQDLLWDVQALALRAFEVLQGFPPKGFEALRLVAEYRRARLQSLMRSILDGTDEYGRLFAGHDPTEGFSIPY